MNFSTLSDEERGKAVTDDFDEGGLLGLQNLLMSCSDAAFEIEEIGVASPGPAGGVVEACW